jgi:hypothetical protein
MIPELQSAVLVNRCSSSIHFNIDVVADFVLASPQNMKLYVVRIFPSLGKISETILRRTREPSVQDTSKPAG